MSAGLAAEDGSDDCEEEDEALERYAPSQAGRAVAGLQHSHSRGHLHRAPRPPTSSDTGTTQDTDDWHKTRSLFNVAWSDHDENADAGRPPLDRSRRTSSLKSQQSQLSQHTGSENNV